MTTPLADFSDERKAAVIKYLRGKGILTSELSAGGKLCATIGALICDDSGHVTEADLESAYADPSIINAARQIMVAAAL